LGGGDLIRLCRLSRRRGDEIPLPGVIYALENIKQRSYGD
jgi:hypothetical protein